MEERKTNIRSTPEPYRARSGETPRENVPTMLRQSRVATGESRRADVTSRFGQTGLSPEERRQFIARAAYFRAERRGFAPGSELEDWLAAEAEFEREYPSSGFKRSA